MHFWGILLLNVILDKNLPFMWDHLESMCNKNTEPHTGNIKYSLCYDKPHREEEVGCWNKRQDNQRQGLQDTHKHAQKKEIICQFIWQAQSSFFEILEHSEIIMETDLRGKKSLCLKTRKLDFDVFNLAALLMFKSQKFINTSFPCR